MLALELNSPSHHTSVCVGFCVFMCVLRVKAVQLKKILLFKAKGSYFFFVLLVLLRLFLLFLLFLLFILFFFIHKF